MSVTNTRKLDAPDRRKTCSNCNHVGHLAPTCEREQGLIDKIGIEVEGFWADLRAIQRVVSDKGWPGGNSDGSLMARDGGCDECNGSHSCTCDYCTEDHDTNDCGYEHECQCSMCECSSSCSCYHPSRTTPTCSAWEFQTRPGTLGEQIRALQVLYPDFTNSSAGMHVHLSFRDNEYGAAMSLGNVKFFSYWADRWTAWGKRLNVKGQFWKRLQGENKYSSPNGMGDWAAGETSLLRTMDRRRQINFQAWNEHKTVEFRLLPMFRDCKIAISAVCELVSIIEDWLLMEDSSFEVVGQITNHAPLTVVSECYSLTSNLETPTNTNVVRVVHVAPVSKVEGIHIVPKVMLDAKVKSLVAQGLRT